MDFRKISAFLLVFFLLPTLFFSEILKGKELSDQIYTYSRLSGGKPKIQNLISSLPNAFPYNIENTFPSTVENDDRQPLIFLMPQEEVVECPSVIQQFMEKIISSENHREIRVVFVYGNNAKPEKQNDVNGTRSYISLSENPNGYYINCHFNQSKTSVLCGSHKKTSTSSLVKTVFKAFAASKLSYDGNYFLSQIYKMNLFSDNDLDLLFNDNHDAITVRFKNESPEIISTVLADMAFSSELDKNSDNHSVIFTFLGKVLSINENINLLLLFIVILSTLFLLFLFSSVGKSFELLSWYRIKEIWFYPLIFLGLILLSLYSTRWLFGITEKLTQARVSPVSYIFTSTTFCFVLVSALTITVVNLPLNFKKRTVDYLILYITAINLLTFILFDISLIPFYYFIFILSLISVFIKKTRIHLFCFIAVHLPFIPFVNTIFCLSDTTLFSNMIFDGSFFPLIVAMNILPVTLIWFRVLTGINFNMHKEKIPVPRKIKASFVITIAFLLLNTLFFVSVTGLSARNLNNQKQILPEFEKINDSDAKLSYKQRQIFGETIRTIYVDTGDDCLQAELKITGKTISPVIFSDNENILENNRTTEFLIPPNPPKQMEFSFGTDSSNDTAVLLTLWYESPEEGKYLTAQKNLIIRGNH